MTTVTKTKLKKYAKVSGIAAIPLGLLLIVYLVSANLITITGNSGDMSCAGTIEDPCLALINFTANDDISIGKLDDKGLFYTDKSLKDVKVINLKTKKELNFSKTNSLKKGQNYSWMIIAYKINPHDTIKWGFGPLDPTWYPEIDYNITQSPDNNTSYNLLNNIFQCNATLYDSELGSLNSSNIYIYENGILIQNASKVITGTTNSSTFNLNVYSGNHTWFCSFNTIGSFNGNFNFTANPLNSSKIQINNSNYSIYDSTLRLMYNFDNISNLGENATKVVDVSLYGNNGNVSGAIWNSSGKYGGAYQFDGVDDYINITTPVIPENNFTISFWTVINNLSVRNTFFDQYVAGQAGRFMVWSELTTGKIDFIINGADKYSNTGLTTGVWHHIVIIRKGTEVNFYLDGEYDGTQVISSNDIYQGINTKIGLARFTPNPLNGILDEIRIYNRTLNATEVNILYNSNLAKYGSTNWNFIANQTNLSVNKFCYISQNTETCVGNIIDTINGSVYNLFNPANVFIGYTNASALFIFRNNKINQSLPDGQTNATGFYNVTNFNVKNISIYSSVNYTVPQVTLKAADNWNYSSAIVLNTTNQTIISNLTGGSYNYIWFWADYVNYSGAGFRYAPKLSIDY